MERKELKPGDKVWVFNNTAQEIMDGLCLQVIKHSRRTYITIGFKTNNGAIIHSGGNVLNKDCFPTREALCEHYRKIFE